MTTNEYQSLAYRTAPTDLPPIQARFEGPMVELVHACFGMSTEVGEFQDVIKRALFYGKPLGEAERTNLVEELGDLSWYIALACTALGVSLDAVQTANIAKLRKRFPEKFSEYHALNRDTVTELRQVANTVAPQRVHLRYCLRTAYDLGITSPPQKWMRDNGISYTHAIPQPMGDQWWFWNCVGFHPSVWPNGPLYPLNLHPMECVGFGLSPEEASAILNTPGCPDAQPAPREFCEHPEIQVPPLPQMP